MFGHDNRQQRLIFLAAVAAAGEMLLDRREQLAEFRSVGDQIDQTVKLSAAFLAVDAAVGVGIKNTINQFMQIVVHNFTHRVLRNMDGSTHLDLTSILQPPERPAASPADP